MDTNLETDASPNYQKSIEQKPNTNSDSTANKKSRSSHSKTRTNNVFKISHSKDVHIGPYIIVNADKKVRKTPPPMPETVLNLTKNGHALKDNVDTMMTVKQYIGEHWKDVFRKLNYTEGQIFQFTDLHKSVGETSYQLLIDWTQNSPKEATVGNLISALWSAGEVEVVEQISKHFVN